MALILGSPNGGTRRPSWAGTAYGRGVRREVKHLSTCRKGYSVSSGERKRIRPNRLRVIPVGVAFPVSWDHVSRFRRAGRES